MSTEVAEWEQAVKDAVQTEQDESDEEAFQVFEAKVAALDACETLIQTLKECLLALEEGSLKEADRLVAEESTNTLLQTMRQRVHEVIFFGASSEDWRLGSTELKDRKSLHV